MGDRSNVRIETCKYYLTPICKQPVREHDALSPNLQFLEQPDRGDPAVHSVGLTRPVFPPLLKRAGGSR